jgi:uncharacterized protein YwgA
MNRLQRAVVLADLARQLAQHGSWCGETHMQKAVYMLQELTGKKLGYDYMLYKHGPYSFDLRDEITGLRADGIFTLRPRPPYGPTLAPTEAAKRLKESFAVTAKHHNDAVNFIAEAIGNKSVVELERLGTALFVTREEPDQPVEERARRLHELKPHVPLADATEAVKELDVLRRRVAPPSQAAHT